MNMNEIPKGCTVVDEIIINKNLVKRVNSITPGVGIENSYVNTEPYLIKSSIATKDFLQFLKNETSGQTQSVEEILPNNCKFIKYLKDGGKVLVLEDEPQIRTISIDIDYSSVLKKHMETGKYYEYELDKIKQVRPYKFTLSFPYIIYILSLTRNNEYLSMSIFFRLNPISSLHDYLLTPCLPNISNEYNICLGYYSPEKHRSLAEEVRTIMDSFWFNNFNIDYYGLCNSYEIVPEVTDFFTWQYYTKKDPLFIFSTKWLPIYNDNKIEDIIDIHSKYETKIDTSSPELMFSHLRDIISYNIEQKVGSNVSVEKTRDLDSSISLNGIILNIGDKINYYNKEYYIVSFEYNNSSSRIEVIEMEDEEGKIEKINISSIALEQFEQINPTSLKISDDLEVSVRDLISFKNSGAIRAIDKIIQAVDGSYHLKIGKDFYLISSLLTNNIEKFDTSKPLSLRGVELVEGKEYLASYDSLNDRLFTNLEKITYIGYETNSVDLTFKFETANKRIITFTSSSYGFDFIEESRIRTLSLYRVNNKIYTNDLSSNNVKEKFSLLNGKGLCSLGYVYMKDYRDDYIPLANYRKRFLKLDKKIASDILTQMCNEGIITIPSYDRDITFRKDEEVITIDWNNPNEMFKIKKITGFSLEGESFLLANLIDENNETSSFKLIDLNIGECYLENIREVCRELNGLKVGMKIKAKKKGIQDFLVKDCNEIKAFVIDEDIEPLVLTSNYRTIYLNDLDKFNIFDSDDPKFKKLKVSEPDLKIKLQDFDIVENKSYGNTYILISNNILFDIESFRLTTRPSWFIDELNSSNTNNNLIRHGLLLPRHTDQENLNFKPKNGVPTLFSNVIIREGENPIYREWRDKNNV